ncbi:hypothetical protein CIG2463D_1465 [Campylobacter iguaniorum]|uniref:hypothetical protein n=1 Tax=Campylobacter iguaniorum TaxID=1244531 RepID=UPI00073A3407|nr:hypothetical protein [Campylobacter iguaniorum]ALV25030.1 hypothetical protein CIG2463D_1465 [Campylobacter iguaniorum]
MKQLLKRQKIIDDLSKKMQEISIKNGYYSDIGSNVSVWKDSLSDELPALILRDVSDNLTHSNTTSQHSLNIQIDIIAKGLNASWDIRQMCSDVLRAFGEYEQSSNLECLHSSSEFVAEQKESFYILAKMEFSVIYHTKRWEQ